MALISGIGPVECRVGVCRGRQAPIHKQVAQAAPQRLRSGELARHVCAAWLVLCGLFIEIAIGIAIGIARRMVIADLILSSLVSILVRRPGVAVPIPIPISISISIASTFAYAVLTPPTHVCRFF
jgi:hypothetical protein